MTLTVRQFPCLSDNYFFLIRDEASGKTAVIDTPDATAILAELKTLGWGLDFIFNTHWHPDHAGGNAEIKAATGCTIVGPAEVTRIAPLDRTVMGGDVVELGETSFKVIETGGHTLGHIAYFDACLVGGAVGHDPCDDRAFGLRSHRFGHLPRDLLHLHTHPSWADPAIFHQPVDDELHAFGWNGEAEAGGGVSRRDQGRVDTDDAAFHVKQRTA